MKAKSISAPAAPSLATPSSTLSGGRRSS